VDLPVILLAQTQKYQTYHIQGGVIMASIIYVGMDVHTTNFTFCCFTADSDRGFAVAQTEPDYRQVIKYMERVQKQRGEECKFVCGYEAGCLGYSLYHQLTRYGVDCVMNIYTNFHRFLRKAGISYGGKGKGPRVYDLRHTFAVHCLRHLVLSGKDIAVYHQALKTYMGHSFFKYTAYYLKLTTDMFPDIREKMEVYYKLNIDGSVVCHE